MDRVRLAGLCHQRDCDPHRMGAALTYARRYALFTLVGIAGETILQRAHLNTLRQQPSGPERPKAGGNGRLNGGHLRPALPPRRSPGRTRLPIQPMLGPEASAELRNRLVTELAGFRRYRRAQARPRWPLPVPVRGRDPSTPCRSPGALDFQLYRLRQLLSRAGSLQMCPSRRSWSEFMLARTAYRSGYGALCRAQGVQRLRTTILRPTGAHRTGPKAELKSLMGDTFALIGPSDGP